MIRISKKGDAAIFLLTDLARAEARAGSDEDGSNALMSASELAESSGRSRFLVANLLKDLTRAGILTSTRGSRGGYQLARPAEDISLREILSVAEGPLVLIQCADGQDKPEADEAEFGECGVMNICPAMGPLSVLHNKIIRLLDEMSLAELASTSPFQTAPFHAPYEHTAGGTLAERLRNRGANSHLGT